LQRDLIKILGVNIDNVTLEEVGLFVKDLIENSNKNCKMVVSPNTEFIMTAWKDKEFYEVLKHADFSTPDSVGVSIGGKLQKRPFKERIPGQSVFRKTLEVGEKEGWTFYFLGGEDGIAQKAKENVLKDYPNCKIVGCHEGFFENHNEKEVINEINELQPNVLFVAMGAPLQEKWIYSHQKELKVDVAFGQRRYI
jgi:N-acetylglucosaminyldiphosphoundecaprenol N-acetyl-beta-D-mannosaminyltransferase